MGLSTLLALLVIGTASCEMNFFGGPFDAPSVDRHFFPFPIFPRPPRPAREFFVGSFLSNPTSDPQVNMWNIYTATGLGVKLINENVTLRISREGDARPASYRVVETASSNATNSNQTLLDYVFQLGVRNTTTVYGQEAEYLVAARGDLLSFVYNITGSGITRVDLDFDGRRKGLTARYTTATNIRGKREFGRRL